MLTHSSKTQPQLFTALALAARCAGLDMVLLAPSLEQKVGATEQKVSDAVGNVCALKCSAPEDQLRVTDATQELGCNWWVSLFYQLKQRATLLRSLLAICCLQQ